MEQLWGDVEYTWGTSLHDGDVEESLMIKTPQWRRGEVLEKKTSLMEDMDSYFIKWREWKNIDLGNKSSMFIKGAENDETRIRQPINQ